MSRHRIDFVKRIAKFVLQCDPYFKFICVQENRISEDTSAWADIDFVVFISDYGKYIIDMIVQGFEQGRVVSSELQCALKTIEGLVIYYDEDKWGEIHDGIISWMVPDDYYRVDKEKWILSLFDKTTSGLIERHYLIMSAY